MKPIFIEAKRKFIDSETNFKLLDKIPGKTISLAATIQYIGLIPKIKKYLENRGKIITLKKGAFYEGHILGCNSSAFDSSADTLLLITDGKFHAINNAIQLQREITVFNGHSLEKVEKKDIEAHNKKILAKKKKFLLAENIGLILSTKSGQFQKAIEKIKTRIEKTNKKVYLFESNNINVSELENFPEIQIWVNTACYGLARDDKNIINLVDILEFLN